MITGNLVKGTQKSLLLAQDFDTDLGHNLFEELLLSLLDDVPSSFSSVVRDTLIKRDYDTLIQICDIKPHQYNDWKSYLQDAQICAFVKKYPYWKTSYQPRTEAMKTFIACEIKCSHTNDTLWSSSPFKGHEAVEEVLFLAQKKIASILGTCPTVSELDFEFGPGAAYSVKRNTTALDKLSSPLDVTTNCYGLADDFLRTCPGWRSNVDLFTLGPPVRQPLRVVVGDRLSFVPKTAKTDRPIAIGPLLNVLLQKGIGKAIRARLRSCYDLNQRQDYHRKSAMESSRTGKNCTIDLKSASDTIAYALVHLLLPKPWFELLDRCRSQSYSIDGKCYSYQKFSAMGNGYTFELETLIFYAITFAVCKHYGYDTSGLSVYGDDIIAPTAAFEHIVRILALLGFDANLDKSFHQGQFRESCGGDYFDGYDVRPFYMKDRISFRVLFLLHNFLVRKGTQFVFPTLYRKVRKLIGRENLSFFKTWNPLDDGALLDFSVPKCSYNTLISVEKNRKENRSKRRFGVSFLLYRINLSDKQSDKDLSWLTYKSRIYRLSYRNYRHVHI